VSSDIRSRKQSSLTNVRVFATGVASFISGGALPPARRGQTETGLMHICDWLGTFAALAGAKSFDFKAHANGLPPVDRCDTKYAADILLS
jgi:hypothetical protein